MRQRIPYKQSAKAYQALVDYYDENFIQFQEEKSKHHKPQREIKVNNFKDLASVKTRVLKSLIGKKYMLFNKKHTIDSLKEAEIVSSLNYQIL